jgi:predicted TIM-barrel fold metal-dependent hydrolase
VPVKLPQSLVGRRIIDVHTHVSYHGHSIDDAVRNMDALGIERAWLLTWEAPHDEYGPGDHRYLSPHQVGLPFDDVVRAIERYPERFVAGWAIDPRRPYAINRLRAAVETYGVRVYGELKLRLMYDDLDLIEMYRACGELGLPVLVHLEIELPNPGGVSVGGGIRPYWFGGEFDVLERFLAKCPDTTFIGHAPGFWREISGDASIPEMYPHGPVRPGGRLPGILDRFPNLWCDLSAPSGLNALSRDPEHVRRFIETYQDRLLFGRDYWDDALLAFLASLELPDGILTKVLSGNALRLVPLASR